MRIYGATQFPYKLGVGFARCEKNDEKSAPMFVPISSYHKEVEALKPTKTHYPSNPKPFFNPKREERKETPKPREEAFICIFCDRASHLDEFCFRRKRIEKRCLDYARRERGKVLRAEGLLGLLGVLGVSRARKLCWNPFGFDEVF
jgi:hypothetical protein